LGDRDLGNGTPLADATAVAVAADARSAGAGAREVRDLTDEVLLEAADSIHHRINRIGHWYTLPFGTLVNGARILSIGDRAFVADADRPGLHPVEIVRPGVHGLNLERLLAMIELRIRRKPWRTIPLPTLKSVLAASPRCHLEFRPFIAAGGVVLQHPILRSQNEYFCAFTLTELEKLAHDVAKAMEKLWVQRKQIADRAKEIRCEVESLLISAHGPLPPVSIRYVACAF
jgi:hypothetical protein